jgi:hypothetical protein
MRKANSELYVHKNKAEKHCKNKARLLEAQKSKSINEKNVVVERMRKVFERDTAVAVADATVRLEGDLKKTIRGVTGLKATLGKTEVTILIIFEVQSPFLFVYCTPSLSFCLSFSSLLGANNILVQTLVHSALKINELEAILKKAASLTSLRTRTL